MEKKINLPIVINKIIADEKISKLRIELKQLSKKSEQPIELNNFDEKKNFSNLIYQNSGIYIINNRQTGKFYIGKSEDLTRRLIDHRNRLFNNSHRNTELQKDFKQLLGKQLSNFQGIYDTFEIQIVVAELFKYKLDEKDQVSFENVLQNLEFEIRDWFHANDYTNTYNVTLTMRQKQKLLDKKKYELKEKQRGISEKHRQQLKQKQQRAIPYEIIKKAFPNAPANSVPVVDTEEKNIYVNARAAAANVSPKSMHSSNITEKMKNPLNQRYRHASAEEVEQKCYLPIYDYFFDDALKKALDKEDVLLNESGRYVFNRKKLEQERKEMKTSNKNVGRVGIPQQAINAAVNANSKPFIDVITKKYYPNLIVLVKESEKLISQAKFNFKRIHKTTLHRQISNSLNKRYRYASEEEIKKKCYIPFYDHLFEDAIKASVETGTIVMGKRGTYRKTRNHNYSRKKNKTFFFTQNE